jgi:glycosyltransferase involved in cell wall biosynthesis
MDLATKIEVSTHSVDTPTVSIIIPARNEEQNIVRCLESLTSQKGPSFEIFVVDDHSDDGTRRAAEKFVGIHVLSAVELPEGWTGKANAIQTAIPYARGRWLLFTDADTVHEANSLCRSVTEAESGQLSLLSYSPAQLAVGFWEQILQPVIFSELSSRFPYDDVNNPDNQIAAANGQYILVLKDAYDRVGGHRGVHSSLLEDVALATAVKRIGRVKFRYGPDIVSARMYCSLHDLVEGWTKNLALLFPDAIFLALRRLFDALVLILGPVAVAWLLFNMRYTVATLVVATILVQSLRLFIRLRKAGWSLSTIPKSVLGLPFFAALLLRSYWMLRIKKQVTWKQRPYTT